MSPARACDRGGAGVSDPGKDAEMSAGSPVDG